MSKIKKHLRCLIKEPKIKSSNRLGMGRAIYIHTHEGIYIHVYIYTGL